MMTARKKENFLCVYFTRFNLLIPLNVAHHAHVQSFWHCIFVWVSVNRFFVTTVFVTVAARIMIIIIALVLHLRDVCQ